MSKEMENTGQDGSAYWLECVNQFDSFDVLEYMSEKDTHLKYVLVTWLLYLKWWVLE